MAEKQQMVIDRSAWPDLAGKTLQEKIASVDTWYHTIDLHGELTPGHYDMRNYVRHYRLPTVKALSVVDVGASNGFFSFLFEQMGADVTAIDLPSYRDHDYPQWFLSEELRKRSNEELAAIDWHQLHGGFEVCREVLSSKVTRVLSRVYDMSAAVSRTFDLAFCSNVLVHLRDPLGALEAMRAIISPGGRIIVATPILDRDYGSASPANFVGLAHGPAWWVPAPRALIQWLKTVGFENVELVGRFECMRIRGDKKGDLIGVVHGVRG